MTIVSGSGAAVLDAIRRPVRGGLALPGFAGMLATMRALAAGGAGARRLVRMLDGWGWMPLLTAPLFASAVHPSVVAAFADEIRPAAFARAARLAARYDEECWAGIRCPVRSVRGMRDVFGGDDDDVRFDGLIADFRETRVAGAGHFAHIERPDAVLYALADAERSRTAVARAD